MPGRHLSAVAGDPEKKAVNEAPTSAPTSPDTCRDFLNLQPPGLRSRMSSVLG